MNIDYGKNGSTGGRFPKAKMKEAEVTYDELVKRLEKHGLNETKASVTKKLKEEHLRQHGSWPVLPRWK